MKLEQVILRDTRANQPLATVVPIGTLFCVTDESNIVERSNGTVWQSYSSAAAVDTGITELTGDVTAGPGSGSQASIIVPNAVTTAKILDANVTLAKQNVESRRRTINIIFDGGGAVLTVGIKSDIRLPTAGIITGVRLLAAQVGDIVIDIWKNTYVNFPPTITDTITAAAKPTIIAADKYEDVTLTGWITAFSAGDILRLNIDSVATIQRVTMALNYLAVD